MTSNPKGLDLRSEIERLISAGSADLACLRLAELWRNEPAAGTAAFLVNRYEKLRDALALVPYRVTILRSFTVEPAIPLLKAEAFSHGIDLTVQMGDFNTYVQEIIDPDSSLYRFKPNLVVVAVRTADLAPELWHGYADLAPEAVSSIAERVTNSFSQWIRILRERTSAAVIIHSLELPERPAMGVLDSQQKTGQSATILQINQQLRQIASEHHGVYILDYDGLVARHGRLRWHDERKWITARMPISADHLIHMAREWLRFLVPLCGKTAKVLVADLDNTLWGGVIGEDGMTGIKLCAEYPGAAYQNLQRVMLDLARRGILLAICSKNNSEDAMDALENHPGMLLRPKDFSAMRINWNDKALNLREIASELNVGIEALAFLDDNPVEREQVRSDLPGVMVIDLPEDPIAYAAAVRDCPAFERLALSNEDAQRTSLYAARRERSQTENNFQTKEDFFHYLGQEAEVALVSPATIARVAQLTQKTNQFNLTTRRYTEQEIEKMANRPGCVVLSIKVRDRFGDHGLVGVAITRDDKGICEIDTFLLSCRVIGRSVETALLASIVRDATARGCKHLQGWFLPTRKNSPAGEFYPQHGFEITAQNNGASLWLLDLERRTVDFPQWIKVS
ncbi:MAG: HAD-IIIC family phosphatase [Candidatus Sulfotelmatobacter sp.]